MKITIETPSILDAVRLLVEAQCKIIRAAISWAVSTDAPEEDEHYEWPYAGGEIRSCAGCGYLTTACRCEAIDEELAEMAP